MLQSVILSLLLAAPPAPISWRDDYAGALAASQQFNVPLLIVVESHDCKWCVALDKATWPNETVRRIVTDRYVALKIDGEKERELAKDLGAVSYPTIIIAAPDGTYLSFDVGFVEPDKMATRLKAGAGLDLVQKTKAAPPKTKMVPCRKVVTEVSRSFRDGSHEHRCPVCGTSWVHGGKSGNPVSHTCPGMREVRQTSSWNQTPAREQAVCLTGRT